MERMTTRGFVAKKIAAALGVPEATTKRWLRSDGDVASGNMGQKHVINMSFDSMALSTDTVTAPQNRQHVVKPCYFVTHPEPKISSTKKSQKP